MSGDNRRSHVGSAKRQIPEKGEEDGEGSIRSQRSQRQRNGWQDEGVSAPGKSCHVLHLLHTTFYEWLFKKESLNTVQFKYPILTSHTAQLALYRESKSKDSKMISLENKWKTPTSWVRTWKQTDCTTFSLTNKLCIDKVLIQCLLGFSPCKSSVLQDRC